MYVIQRPLGTRVLHEGAVVFSGALGDDAMLEQQLQVCAGALAQDQESRANLTSIVLRSLGTAPRRAVLLLQSADQLLVREFLLRWHRLNVPLAGCCSVVRDCDEFATYVTSAAVTGFEVYQAAESRDDIEFYPAYELITRAEALSLSLSAQGVAAWACWRLSSLEPQQWERQLRINLVRLQRSWIPERVRDTQKRLIERFLGSSCTARQFVVAPESGSLQAVGDALGRDCSRTLDPQGFSRSVMLKHEQLDVSQLPEAESDSPCVGDSVMSGFLLDALTRRISVVSPLSAREAPQTPLRIFISYSHKDKEFATQLATSCAQLRRDGWIKFWSDAEILPGAQWRDDINDALRAADLIVLLISPDFVQSDFCYGIEMRHALERHSNNTARVVPVIVRATDTVGAPFAHLQMLPAEGKPITGWADRDMAWLDVARGLRRLLETRRGRAYG